MFERGFELLGLKLEDTTEPFEGAATAVHPLLIESAVKFQAKASTELFPAKGPVKAQVLGEATLEKTTTSQPCSELYELSGYNTDARIL
jgi:hypothetical protein